MLTAVGNETGSSQDEVGFEVGFELLRCDGCDHEYVRAVGKRNTLPCGRCRGRTWMAYVLVLGTARKVSVVPPSMPEFMAEVRRVVVETP